MQVRRYMLADELVYQQCLFAHKEHRCDVAGCGNVIILDGNMKNSRQVCFATEAGHTEFSGLEGTIRTGCPNTPAFKSRYCVSHSTTVTTPKDVQFGEDGNPVSSASKDAVERHAALIINKRVTRHSTFYEVSQECTIKRRKACKSV